MKLIDRSIVWGGEVTQELCLQFAEHFLELKKSEDPINIIIMGSEGGDWPSGLAVMDLIQNADNWVNTYALGEVCSTAAFWWATGDSRIVAPNSALLYHNGSAGLPDDERVEAVFKLAEVTQKMCEDTYDFLSKQSGKKPPGFFRDKLSAKTDWWVFAEELIEIGLATEIGTP